MEAVAPDTLLPVIITLSNKADLSALRSLDRRQRRIQAVRLLRDHAARTQPPLIAALRGLKAAGLRRLWLINGVAARVPAGALARVSALPGVESVRLDGVLHAPPTALALPSQPEWNLGMIRAPELWAAGFTGRGVVVATMDTGVDVQHPDLAGRWRGGTNSWFDPYGEHPEPFDSTGHGTQVMGLLVGGDAGGTAIGVAPDARWISTKIFDDAGDAPYSAIHAAFQWLLDPDGNPAVEDAPDIVNASWGFDGNPNECLTEFEADVQALRAAHIVVVVAGGNGGNDQPASVSPANYPESLAVGAVDMASAAATFSGGGPSACDGTVYPELMAPGVGVLTTDRTFGVDPNSYITTEGTSVAAPHVAGALALLLSAFPDAAVPELEMVLEQSALDLGAAGPDESTGYGLLDVMEAYLRLKSLHPVDADGDGYVAELDCNDADAAVYPGAAEIKHDGIDQDCNGYDLTIDITVARFLAHRLHVEAKSALGKDAQLTLVGYGPMRWSRLLRRWTITVTRLAASPLTVTVSGKEGAESRAVTRLKPPRLVATDTP